MMKPLEKYKNEKKGEKKRKMKEKKEKNKMLLSSFWLH